MYVANEMKHIMYDFSHFMSGVGRKMHMNG
jgi:hypothetical protein